MADDRFQNHSGGVVHVHYDVRYGSVPEALLEDSRLGLDTRAVAAWLAMKPAGWQILVGVLQSRLELGKDRWGRISRELEAAGYLRRRRAHGPRGQWLWNIVFNPVPMSRPSTMGGFPGDGAHGSGQRNPGRSGTGTSDSGLPEAGSAGNIEVPDKKKHLSKKQSTTTQAPIAAAGSCTASRYRELFWARAVEPHKDVVVACLDRSEMDMPTAQKIVDELAGCLEAAALGKRDGIASIQGWVAAVVRRCKKGSFVIDLGRVVARRRDQATTDSVVHGSSVHQSHTSREKGRENLRTLLQTRDGTGRLNP